MSNQQYNSFWDIIKDHKIEIPTIQRDYVYGRKSAEQIRSKLIADIAVSIKENKSINLDFVYGKLIGKENVSAHERNKSNIQSLLKSIKSYAKDLDVELSYDVTKQEFNSQNNATFIPLDGQQRLTTLYLVHWYFAQIFKDFESLKILKGFSYSTRISSKDFCKMLCENQFTISTSMSKLSDVISNHEKFFSFWQKDPTVKSMLVVIDEIHFVFANDINLSLTYWSNLKTNNLVSFDFFDLEDFELTDDLYIKMNARGKQLTHFENFKAWLIYKHDKSITVPDWEKKFDLKWTDLFWKYKSKSSYKIDDEFLQFFKILYLADYLKNIKTDDSSLNDEKDLNEYTAEDWRIGDFNSVIAILRNKDSNPLALFKANKEFIKRIDGYLYILDDLNFDVNLETDFIKKYTNSTLADFLFGERVHKYNWWDTTFHYAITRYLLKLDGEKSHFKEWVRVISNLIYNTKIDSPQLFIDAINSIDTLLNKVSVSKSVYKLFSDLTKEDIDFFSPNQREEEIKKAKLILSDYSWENLFIKAENHSYFYGQIGFIFRLDVNENDINIFDNNFEKVASLFSDAVLNDSTYLLTRTFLTQGDCFYHEGNNRIFNSNIRGTLRNRTENWRKFFESKTNFIKKIIDHSRFNKINILKSLEEIIEFENPNLKNNFETRFICNNKLFDYCKRNHVRKYDFGYYLLNSTKIFGYFVELYTYDWYLINVENFKANNSDINILYMQVKGEDNDPYIQIEVNSKKKKIQLDCKSGLFILNDTVNISTFNSIQDAVDKAIK